MTVPLVLLEGNSVKRYVNGKCTDKAEATRPLTPEEIEAFRLNPNIIDDDPEAA